MTPEEIRAMERAEAGLARIKSSPNWAKIKERHDKLIDDIGNVEGDDVLALALLAAE